jgi:3-oxoacyl-[acyl-carrier-protein] synthase-1
MASVPVIGMGAVSAAGIGIDNSVNAVLEGKSCLSPLTLFDSGLKETPLCGQVNDELYCGRNGSCPNRTAAIAMQAVNEALFPVKNRESLSLGMVLATTVAGMTDSEIFYKELRNNPDIIKEAKSYLSHHEPSAITGTIAMKINAQGVLTISTACSTGLHAIGMAKRLIEENTFDICLAVGVDALSILTIRGFASLMLIDYSGCKPFDKNRKGISIGEGSGALLLASDEVVKRLEVKPLALISGWGASADCHHMTAPHPDGDGAIRATMAALKEARLKPEDIGMIAAHGTATLDNDAAEIAAMRTIFKPLPQFYSMKGTFGHTLAASGALESVFSICALNKDIIPKTAGFHVVDDAIDAEPSLTHNQEAKHILKNSFGFGGNNAAIIISRSD